MSTNLNGLCLYYVLNNLSNELTKLVHKSTKDVEDCIYSQSEETKKLLVRVYNEANAKRTEIKSKLVQLGEAKTLLEELLNSAELRRPVDRDQLVNKVRDVVDEVRRTLEDA